MQYCGITCNRYCSRGICQEGCGGEFCENDNECLAFPKDSKHYSPDACKLDGGLKGQCRDAGCPSTHDSCDQDSDCIYAGHASLTIEYQASDPSF